MRTVWSASLVLVLVVTTVACGGDDERPHIASQDDGDTPRTASTSADPADAAPGTGNGPGAPAAPQVDATAMPGVGNAQFVVEGTAYDFAGADAAGGAASTCTVDPGVVTVELQTSPGALLVQAGFDGQRWQGSVTIRPPGVDRIYFSAPGFDGTFAVEETMAVYEGTFYWRTADDPAHRAEAGIGTVRMAC
jgi:hypothetical protein